MSIRLDHDKVQRLFDDAVTNGAAPGFQFCAFDKDSLLVNGVTGLATLASDDTPARPMRFEDAHWIASAGKIALSLVILIILERKMGYTGMGMEDLDNHKKLIEILPEFDHNAPERSIVTKIITGFEDEVDKEGKKVPILKDSKTKMTLRMLLNYTAGFSLPVSLAELRTHCFAVLNRYWCFEVQ